ncbi:MAG: helix-turn-helix transcriptional regulator [Deltaproteobacteria bacterium]|nr:helix-turn-helix transcriptional regulator [Deltaproteobacteria bacterium]MBW2119680.1 helix-turn-helix transcriptional regulator [Deltaproteobacteria bacterium]
MNRILPDKELNVKKIIEKLESMGLSQSKLASELGVSRQVVSKWMKSEKFPRPEKLLKLAHRLKLSFDEIVVRLPSEGEPVIAFRKKGTHKISDDYIEAAKYTGSLLEKLVPYLPFDNLSRPPSLIDPKLNYEYIHWITKEIRAAIGATGTSEISFQSLISFFNQHHAVIIPVFWGNKDQHENALHIYLPKTMTTWIYLNLDSKIHDFKFWMAHELGHIKSPDLKGDEAEDFADDFAGALLIDEDTAKREYIQMCRLRTIPKQINRLKETAENLVVSPITVYYEINKYARHINKSELDLEKNRAIYKATTVFNKQFNTVSQSLFKNKKPTASEYIACPGSLFQSPFFDALRSFLRENKKSAGFIQSVLNLPLADAQYLYEELC